MRALAVGFARVNYEHRSGAITIEALQKFWRSDIKEGALDIVRQNIGHTDRIVINLLNDEAVAVQQDYAELFRYSDEEKPDHLPALLTESVKRRAKKPSSALFSETLRKAMDGTIGG
jgi:hypothetical protein